MTRVLFIGKRHYTNRDALEERYGRIYQLPMHWSQQEIDTHLWLIDYHGHKGAAYQDGLLRVSSTPVRGFGWIIKALGLVLARVRRRAPTHVVASGDAYLGLFGWLLARLSGAVFVFDVYDKYDTFGGYRKPLGLDLFGFLLRHADRCWFASRRLLTQMGDSARGDTLIANGIDTRRFKSMDKQVARQRLCLPRSGLMIGYIGSMEPDRGVSDLLSAISMLRTEGLGVSLILAGRKDSNTPIPDKPWIYYLGNLPFSDVPYAYAAMDVFAIPYRRSPFMDAGASNKIGEALACDCALAPTATPNLLDNFPEQVGLLGDRLAEPGHAEDLARVIKAQLANPIQIPLPYDLEYKDIAVQAKASMLSLSGTPEDSDRSTTP